MANTIALSTNYDTMTKDLRRINNQRLSIRTVKVLEALSVKTIYSAKRLDWDSLVGTRVVRTYPHGGKTYHRVGAKVRDEVMGFI